MGASTSRARATVLRRFAPSRGASKALAMRASRVRRPRGHGQALDLGQRARDRPLQVDDAIDSRVVIAGGEAQRTQRPLQRPSQTDSPPSPELSRTGLQRGTFLHNCTEGGQD